MPFFHRNPWIPVALSLMVPILCACGSGSIPVSASPAPPPKGSPMTDARRDAMPPSSPQPHTRQAGQIVPGTTVTLPRTASAGSRVTGRAPAASTVTFDAVDLTVPASGQFVLQMPDQPGQTLPVRVQRPGRTALTLQITLTAAQP